MKEVKNMAIKLGNITDCTITTNPKTIELTGTLDCADRCFYTDTTLDFLLKDIIDKKAKEVEQKKEKEKIEFNRKIADKINDKIEQVVFHDPATIINWKDGHKTVVKCEKGDTYSKEFGFALCLIKEFFDNTGVYNKIFEKWID